MDDSFTKQLEAANSLLLLLPAKPTFDEVAAGLAFYLALRTNKEVVIACPNDVLVEHNQLVGANKISKELGNKNLVITFVDYQGTGIERVSADIENGEFKLTTIPKPGVNPPAKDQVHVSYTGVSADTVILIGGKSEESFPVLSNKDLASTKKMHLGVRQLQTQQEVMSFARPSSSVSELVGAILKQAKYKYDTDIASNLLMGIEEGGKHYSSDEVTADTFQMAADLLRAGGKRKKPQVKKDTFPPGAIPGQTSQQMLQQAYQQAQQMAQRGAQSGQQNQSQGGDQTPKSWTEPKIFKGTSVS